MLSRRGNEPLYAPDIKFNRDIGRWAGQKFHAKTGAPLSDSEYELHVREALPNAEDKAALAGHFAQ